MYRNFEFRFNAFFVLAIAFVFFCICCEEANPVSQEPQPPAPLADFRPMHVEGFDDTFVIGEDHYGSNYATVNFLNYSAHFDECLWNFGDGGQSVARTPEHVYSDTGTYTVTLTVKGEGGMDFCAKRITVKDLRQ